MVGNVEAGRPDTGLKAFAVNGHDRNSHFVSYLINDAVDILTDDTCCTGRRYEDRLRGISLIDLEDDVSKCIGGSEDRVILVHVGSDIDRITGHAALFGHNFRHVVSTGCSYGASCRAVVDKCHITDTAELAECTGGKTCTGLREAAGTAFQCSAFTLGRQILQGSYITCDGTDTVFSGGDIRIRKINSHVFFPFLRKQDFLPVPDGYSEDPRTGNAHRYPAEAERSAFLYSLLSAQA